MSLSLQNGRDAASWCVDPVSPTCDARSLYLTSVLCRQSPPPPLSQGAAKVSTGEVHVVDLMPDDIDEDFPVRVVVGQVGIGDHSNARVGDDDTVFAATRLPS